MHGSGRFRVPALNLPFSLSDASLRVQIIRPLRAAWQVQRRFPLQGVPLSGWKSTWGSHHIIPGVGGLTEGQLHDKKLQHLQGFTVFIIEKNRVVKTTSNCDENNAEILLK